MVDKRVIYQKSVRKKRFWDIGCNLCPVQCGIDNGVVLLWRSWYVHITSERLNCADNIYGHMLKESQLTRQISPIVRNSDYGDEDEADPHSCQKIGHQASFDVSLAQDIKTSGKDNDVNTWTTKRFSVRECRVQKTADHRQKFLRMSQSTAPRGPKLSWLASMKSGAKLRMRLINVMKWAPVPVFPLCYVWWDGPSCIPSRDRCHPWKSVTSASKVSQGAEVKPKPIGDLLDVKSDCGRGEFVCNDADVWIP